MTNATQKPRIAILGAGPTGLEAALAAIEFGYPFTLYEASASAAGYVRSWGHVRLFSPWALDISPRARAALGAACHRLPDESSQECPTGAELSAVVFDPLAQLPEIAPHLRLRTRVIAISREELVKSDEIGTGARARFPFRLLLDATAGAHSRSTEGTQSPGANEFIEHADLVFDCTGTYGHPNPTGSGGIPAPGETALQDLDQLIVRQIPDVFAQPEAWAGKTILLVGSGHSANTAVVDLAELAKQHPGTRVVWALRNSNPKWQTDPEDPLPERNRLIAQAGALAGGASPAVQTHLGVVVEAMARHRGEVVVKLRQVQGVGTGESYSLPVDRVLSLTGAVGDHKLYRQLQVHECYATSGPMKLAAALLSEAGAGADCLDQASHGVETLINPEPGFFILGSKSYGRNNTFLMRVGWQQVDEVFGLLEKKVVRS